MQAIPHTAVAAECPCLSGIRRPLLNSHPVSKCCRSRHMPGRPRASGRDNISENGNRGRKEALARLGLPAMGCRRYGRDLSAVSGVISHGLLVRTMKVGNLGGRTQLHGAPPTKKFKVEWLRSLA